MVFDHWVLPTFVTGFLEIIFTQRRQVPQHLCTFPVISILYREVKSREISPANLLLSLTVGTKHSECSVALGSCFVFLLISVGISGVLWRHWLDVKWGIIALTNFLPRFYKCGVLLYVPQPIFATPLLIFAATEASNLKFIIQLVFGKWHAKTTFWTKIGGGLG